MSQRQKISVPMVEEDAVAVLRELWEWKTKFGLLLWLEQGVVLGAIREKRFIPHDNDIDLGFRVEKSAPILQNLGFLRDRGFSTSVYGTHIYLSKNGVNVALMGYQEDETSDYCFLLDYVSLNYLAARWQQLNSIATHRSKQTLVGRVARFEYKITAFRIIRKFLAKLSYLMWKLSGGFYAGYKTPKHFYCTLNVVSFYGMSWLVPSDTEAYLAYKYGSGWRVPNEKWNIWRDDGGLVHRIDKVFPRWKILEDFG